MVAVASAAVLAASLGSIAPTHAAPAEPSKPAGDHGSGSSKLIDERAHGEKAIAKLGSKIAEAADRNGLSTRELAKLLRTDSKAWVDTTGQLFYIDSFTGPTQATAAEAAPYPYEQTFSLHSKPGSARTIYLDFDGHTVSGTAWNRDGVSSTNAQPAFDLDGAPATFSTGERDTIQSVWQRVSEDFAAFDVNVTTADPGGAALRRTALSDNVYGARVLISPAKAAANVLCGSGCSGIAYVGTFDEPDASGQNDFYEPAWVFPHISGNVPKNIADVASHEVGHNLGLNHDGPGYYEGHGGWAPIMGSAYTQPITQWSKGEYTGASNTENDFLVMGNNGAAIRSDDHGDSRTDATPMGSGTKLTGKGIISRNTDKDYFTIARPCGGNLTVDAAALPVGPNLDIGLKVFNGDGVQIAADNPPSVGTDTDWDSVTGLDATVTQAVSAGTYFVEIDGVGARNPASTGYSDYASVGAYTLTASGCGAPGEPASIALVKDVPNNSATITWQPPTDDGGNSVTGYTVTRTGASPITVGAATRSYTFTGLTPGAEYTVGVAAINATGTGEAATRTFTMVAIPPGPPQNVTLNPDYDYQDALLRWQAPEVAGDTEVTGYVVERSGLDIYGDSFVPLTVGDDTTYWWFDSLKRETPYEFTVSAVSSTGRSIGVVREATLVPPQLATAPQNVTAIPGDRKVELTWEPPADSGTSPVTAYDIVVYDGAGEYFDGYYLSDDGFRSWTVTGLTNGQAYSFGVTAVTDDGYGEEARTPLVTPNNSATVPSAPGIGKALPGALGGSITAKAVWTAPTSNGGSVLTGYKVSAQRISSTGAVLSTTVSGLRPASSRSFNMVLPSKGRYRFTVRAQNAIGASPPSAKSNIVAAR